MSSDGIEYSALAKCDRQRTCRHPCRAGNRGPPSPNKTAAEVIKATQVALRLTPGCAQGRPLRALSDLHVHSKLLERNRGLLLQLLDVRFDGQPGELGLEPFLGALDEDDHWLLVAPLSSALPPFQQLRVRATELESVPLPGSHLLIVENERCLYQRPQCAMRR